MTNISLTVHSFDYIHESKYPSTHLIVKMNKLMLNSSSVQFTQSRISLVHKRHEISSKLTVLYIKSNKNMRSSEINFKQHIYFISIDLRATKHVPGN